MTALDQAPERLVCCGFCGGEGYGATESAAIEDLLRLAQEDYEWRHGGGA